MLTLIYTNKHTRESRKINLNRLLISLLIIAVFVTCIGLYVDFCRMPEKYSVNKRNKLYNDILSGDQDAINYYNDNYISHGVYLYGEATREEIQQNATISEYETTPKGVYLFTYDGNYYYLEK